MMEARWRHDESSVAQRLRAIVLGVALLIVPAAGIAADLCGNGAVDPGEGCDDGGRMAGDCCSPTCAVEETHRCATCQDGIDNDGNARIDAEDPGCATLADYQRAAVVVTASETQPTGDRPSIEPVLLSGALSGDAVDGRCVDATGGSGSCACPRESPACQADGRPCASDADCVAVPYPLGQSRGGYCAGENESDDPSMRCRPQQDLLRIAQSIERIPGEGIDAIHVTASRSPAELSFGPGRHIVDVGAITLLPETELILRGEKDTVLVLRVAGSLDVGDNARVTASDELAADRVLWVLHGKEGSVAIGAGSHFTGTILAPERDPIDIGANARIHGAIMAAGLATEDTSRSP